MTDTLGLLLVVAVTASDIDDRDAATGLLRRLRRLHRDVMGRRRPARGADDDAGDKPGSDGQHGLAPSSKQIRHSRSCSQSERVVPCGGWLVGDAAVARPPRQRGLHLVPLLAGDAEAGPGRAGR
ncbi:hypothetical protein ACWDXD_32385 [Streptomyces sp. NPDC003314]